MADAWAVIAPDGTVAWYPLSATTAVEDLVAGDYAHGALDRAFVTGPLRLMASDVALLAPEHYPPNPLARQVITVLSEGRIIQPWRGHVALTEYERDEETGEWLWPGEMSPEWKRAIDGAVWADRARRFTQHALYHMDSYDVLPELSAAMACLRIGNSELDPSEMDGASVPGDADYECWFPYISSHCGYDPYE